MKMIYKTPSRENMFINALQREVYQPLQGFWLSFADPKRPKGSQFLGVVITISKGLATALHDLRRKNINPGGECQAVAFPLEQAKRIKPEDFDRLLSKQDLIEKDYI